MTVTTSTSTELLSLTPPKTQRRKIYFSHQRRGGPLAERVMSATPPIARVTSLDANLILLMSLREARRCKLRVSSYLRDFKVPLRRNSDSKIRRSRLESQRAVLIIRKLSSRQQKLVHSSNPIKLMAGNKKAMADAEHINAYPPNQCRCQQMTPSIHKATSKMMMRRKRLRIDKK